MALNFHTLLRRKGPSLPCATDPFADPKNDPCNPEGYIPSNVLTAIALTLYLIVAIVQTFNIWKRGARWMAAMTIGCWTFSTGLALRFALHTQPDSKGIYIAEYLFIILSPCAFIAANYVLLGRLARHIGAGQYLLINPRRITLVFVSSDIITFLIQAIGGSVEVAANNDSGEKLGSDIFQAGLILQLVSFLFFVLTFLLFLLRVHRLAKPIWSLDGPSGAGAKKRWYSDWRVLAGALGVSCIGIVIRSIYRVIETSQGFKGPLSTTEGLFYGLDTLPLFVAVSVYLPFWPGRFIGGLGGVGGVGGDERRTGGERQVDEMQERQGDNGTIGGGRGRDEEESREMGIYDGATPVGGSLRGLNEGEDGK